MRLELIAKLTGGALVTAANARTELQYITNDLAKRLVGYLRSVDSGKVKRPLTNIKYNFNTGKGFKVTFEDVVGPAYAKSKVRGLDTVMSKLFKAMMSCNIIVIDTLGEPLKVSGNRTAKAYFNSDDNTIVLQLSKNRRDAETVEHEIRHAVDAAAKIGYSRYTDYDSDSYAKGGSAYYLEPREIHARLQNIFTILRRTLVSMADKSQSATKALSLESKYVQKGESKAIDADFVKHHVLAANGARAFIRELLFTTRNAGRECFQAFVDKAFAKAYSYSYSVAKKQFIINVVDYDSAMLVYYARPDLLNYLAGRPYDESIKGALYEIESNLHDLFIDLRHQYAGLNLKPIVFKKTSRGTKKSSNLQQLSIPNGWA